MEGEKAASALASLGLTVVGTATGAGATPSDKVLAQLVGFDVLLWPDHDEPGEQHMERIARRLVGLGGAARMLRWPGARDKGDDAADAIKRGATVEDVQRWISEATPWVDVEASADARRESSRRLFQGRPPSQASVVVGLTDDFELWRTASREAFFDVRVDGHRETHPVDSQATRDLIRERHYRNYHVPAPNQALQDTIDLLSARARFDGPQHSVALRVGEAEGAIYLDLGDADWRAVEISGAGWRINDEPPVRFVRYPGMLPLPAPAQGGSIELLRPFVRTEDEDGWLHLIGWLLASLRPRGPFPILSLTGEPGAAKSTTARFLRDLVDPNAAKLRAEPRTDRDLIVGARNSWVFAGDNLSTVPQWLSDALCRLSTGGGYSQRQLYSNLEEVLVELQRPVILTSIAEICTRSDLADRTLSVSLPPMPDDRRRPEREIEEDFRRARPLVLGALLDAVACGLRELPDVTLKQTTRLADYMSWVSACEPALGLKSGTMVAAAFRMRKQSASASVESSAVAQALEAWVFKTCAASPWVGTPTQLKECLDAVVDSEIRKDPRRWPATVIGLSGQIRNLGPQLRARGIDVRFGRTPGSKSVRQITIGIVAVVAVVAPADSSEPIRPPLAVGCDDGDDCDGCDAHFGGTEIVI